MTNIQLYLTIGVPTFAVLLAWLSNRADINRLNDKMDKIAESLRAEMIAMRREMHQDMMLLHERVVKVETRQDL